MWRISGQQLSTRALPLVSLSSNTRKSGGISENIFKSRGFVEKRKNHPRSVLASAERPDVKTRAKQQETATHHTDIHHLL
ncbi:unnamed protein product [Malus baccata var. baccata]